ncbi:MaoC/PaaZ C-terminal domain-containing protein [Nocardioides sp. NPDC059952]|uniref:MaoC/PaaZ C-terminal domain-containing protein n=1 Tax=Nocardioides sp. NPDC059952 TaxID=3347014 RepID=UPI003654C038
MRRPDDWIGHDLGRHRVSWTDRDAILYALSVGARADRLDLVFEERLRVLPAFALTLAQWAPDALGAAGAFDPTRAVHGSQRLEMKAPLPASGDLEMSARVTGVWDKSAGAVFDIEVASDHFVATWSILALGRGGFGGDRGPVRPPDPVEEAAWSTVVEIPANAAALYRLNGDRHQIHIDPAAAAAIGQPRPILHGLATLALASLAVAEQTSRHPADMELLEGRFSSVVFPGEAVRVEGWANGGFSVSTARGVAIAGGRCGF